MERGALIGGIAVVGVMAVLAAGFVMVGVGQGSGEAVGEVGRFPVKPPVVASGQKERWKVAPTQPGKPRTVGDPPEAPPVVTDDGVERMPNPKGAGAEVWAERRAASNAAMEQRARGVLANFVAGRDAETGQKTTEIFDHMFSTAGAIRTDIEDGRVTPKAGRDQMAELRSRTIIDLTELLGGDDLAQLRTELRRADATWF